MSSLRYTNTLLTVIAVCLVWQCVRDNARPVRAAATPQVQAVKVVSMPAVVLKGTPTVKPVGQLDVNVAAVYGAARGKEAAELEKGTLPVTVTNPAVAVSGPKFPDEMKVRVVNESLPVNIYGFRGVSEDRPLPVRIEEVSRYAYIGIRN